MMRILHASLLCMVLVACSAPKLAYLSETIPEDAIQQPVFIAKSGASADSASLFTSGRTPGLHFGRATVSIPADHVPGEVHWPNVYPPNPERHFVLSEAVRFGSAQDLRAAARPSGDGERIVFVHGYNTNTAKAVYSAAQIQNDFELDAPVISFIWPSAARPRGYLYDRDSILFARSDLVSVLKDLTQSPGERVSLVGHSMGTALVMEALRELALSGDRSTLRRISSVLLVAPDLDPEVFRSQARDVGALPQPFVVFVSANDQALRLSSFLAFDRRLGAIRTVEDIKGLNVTLIDVTALADGERLNHDIALTSPAAIQLLKGVREGDANAQRALEQYLVSDGPPLLAD